MSRLEDLREAIRDDLDGDEPRLVYADALQAVGDPRGELIAIQCELARLGCDRMRVALWGCPEPLRRSQAVQQRADWIGDALATGDPKRIAKLRSRERGLLDAHEREWARDLPAEYRFGRGFVEHIQAGRNPDLPALFAAAPFARSLELEVHNRRDVFRTPELAQLRQLRVRVVEGLDSVAVIERLAELAQLRELAVHDLSGRGPGPDRLPSSTVALDPLFASPAIRRIEALDLHDQSLDGPHRIGQLLTLSRLRELRLGRNGAAGWLAQTLAASHGAATLEILDLHYLSIRNELVDIATSPHLQSLRALRISVGRDLDCFDEGARAIGEAFPQLRVLNLAFNAFVRYLQDLVAGNGLGQLAHLGLQACQLDDSCARILADAPLFGRLRVLDLRDNRITDRGARALAASPHPTRLELLDLRGNRFQRDTAKLLKQRFPDARVLAGKRST